MRAMTLVEACSLLAVALVLLFVLTPRFGSNRKFHPITAAQSQLATFATALDAFEVDTGGYPSATLSTNGLFALLMPPPGVTNWSGPYLKDVPLDPWGNPYLCESPGRHNLGTYDLVCSGPDGKVGTRDDIRNW